LRLHPLNACLARSVTGNPGEIDRTRSKKMERQDENVARL
jgi:hypothetical protein